MQTNWIAKKKWINMYISLYINYTYMKMLKNNSLAYLRAYVAKIKRKAVGVYITKLYIHR